MRQRQQGFWTATTVAVALGVVVTACTPQADSEPEVSAPPPSSPAPVGDTTDEQSATVGVDAAEVVSVLEALPDDPDAAVSDELVAAVAGTGGALPPGAEIHPRGGSWRARPGHDSGSIEVTVEAPGRSPKEYLVLMDRVAGDWQIVLTIPLGEELP